MRKLKRLIVSTIFSYIFSTILLNMLKAARVIELQGSPQKIDFSEIWNSFEDDKIFSWNKGKYKIEIQIMT